MNTAERLKTLLKEKLEAIYVNVIDESDQHKGHKIKLFSKSKQGGHFVLTIVSPHFISRNSIERQRMIFNIVDAEMQDEVHALQIKAMAPDEWQGRKEW